MPNNPFKSIAKGIGNALDGLVRIFSEDVPSKNSNNPFKDYSNIKAIDDVYDDLYAKATTEEQKTSLDFFVTERKLEIYDYVIAKLQDANVKDEILKQLALRGDDKTFVNDIKKLLISIITKYGIYIEGNLSSIDERGINNLIDSIKKVRDTLDNDFKEFKRINKIQDSGRIIRITGLTRTVAYDELKDNIKKTLNDSFPYGDTFEESESNRLLYYKQQVEEMKELKRAVYEMLKEQDKANANYGNEFGDNYELAIIKRFFYDNRHNLTKRRDVEDYDDILKVLVNFKNNVNTYISTYNKTIKELENKLKEN